MVGVRIGSPRVAVGVRVSPVTGTQLLTQDELTGGGEENTSRDL